MYEMFSLGEEPRIQVTTSSSSSHHNNNNNSTTGGEGANGGQEQHILLSALESGARFPCPASCPQVVYVRILYPCWESDPHKRPSFLQLCTEIQDLLTQY